jgi:lipopolysaccharide/colanic/teichoic acid biosynthesis glycosyltransferase
VKRALDVVLSTAGGVLLTPLLLTVAIAVRLSSPGPILYRQRRLGYEGKPFTVLKFRSMFVNAPDIRNPDGSAFVGETDPRVTPVGRILRRTSLDELPQLFNVLKGDLSLVGPRPDQVDQIRYYTDREKKKLEVRPGITGLAQISGRNSITWEQRKALDVEYVERRSFWLDLRILFKTLPYLILRKDIHSDGGSNAQRSASSR